MWPLQKTTLFVAVIFSLLGSVQSQDLDQKTSITDLIIKSDVSARFANVVVRSIVVNLKETSQETSFVVQMPNTAFISNFTMLIDDDLIVGQVRDKQRAQKMYEEAKERGESAGQVSQQDPDPEREMEIFNIDINVANKSSVVFELTYQELLKRTLGEYVQRISVQPRQIVKNLEVKARYNEPQGFENFRFSLPNKKEFISYSTDSVEMLSTPERRELSYQPSVIEQRQINSSNGVKGEFVVKYDIPHGKDGGLMLTNNNYFVHYFSPSGLESLNKIIVFVIDISGSMGGHKIAQAREAMLSILGKLRYHDHFNILLFNNAMELWSKEPAQANEKNIELAKSYVLSNVTARGGTNINDALLRALSTLDITLTLAGNRGNIIVFLTDGQATAGETNTKTIRKNIRFANEARVSIYSLGFGFNVDFLFLKALSWENGGGSARRIYEDSDAAKQLESFYEEIGSPLLVDINIDYDDAIIDSNDVTDIHFPQYFNGSELVIAGRLKTQIPPHWQANVNGKTRHDLALFQVSPQETTTVGISRGDFTERLWAYMKINSLIKESAIAENTSISEEMTTRALNMSLQYNFVTPLTSMVVLESMNEGKRKKEGYGRKMHDLAMSGASAVGSGLIRTSSKTHSQNDPPFFVDLDVFSNTVPTQMNVLGVVGAFGWFLIARMT